MRSPMKRLYIQEVATRDGFQNEKQFVDTDAKIALIDALSACGFAKIEVTSFTSPKAIPALRDAEAVMHGVTLCDTTGMAYPSQVIALCERVRHAFPELELTLHFHNTRGMALANTLAALDAGIDRFDASLGGIGGCPYAPGATGNVCTEELVHMLALDGYDTSVDLAAVL